MQVNLHNNEGNQFTSYSDNSVTINQTELFGNLVVTPTEIKNIAITSVDAFDLEFLEQIIKYNPDIVIFGTGSSIKYPPYATLQKLQQLGIGFEIMPIPALCRTFNYLIGEGRNVVGILLF